MTPHQTRLAREVSEKTDSVKLLVLLAELCRAIDNEREENIFRVDCREDCREHQRSPTPVFGPQLLQYRRRVAFTTASVDEGT
jgi:hypothetical protein